MPDPPPTARRSPGWPSRLLESLPGGSERGLLTGAGLAFALYLGGVGVALVAEVVLARLLGAGGYGVYRYTIAYASLAVLAAGLGLPTAVLREASRYLAQRNWPRLRGLLRFADAASIAAAVLLALPLAAAVRAFDLPGHGLPALPALLAGLLVCWALVNLESEKARALGSIGVALAPSRVLRFALVPPLAIAIAGGWQELTAFDALAAVTASLALVWLAQRLLVGTRLRRRVPRVEPAYETREWMAIALPLVLVAGFSSLIAQTDTIVLGWFVDPGQVGLYGAAAKVATLVQFPLLAVNAVAAPRFAALHAGGEIGPMRRMVTALAHWIFWPSLAIAAVLVALGDRVLGLFGADFAAAWPLLAVLAAAQIVNAGAGSVGTLMQMTGHQRAIAAVYGWTALLNAVLNVLAIRRFGVLGAALATGLSLMICNLWLHRLVVARIGVAPSIVSALRRTGRG